MQLGPLVGYLDEYLDLGAFDDASVNGLQLEAGGEVTRLAVAVDGDLAGAAAETEAETAVVVAATEMAAAETVTNKHRALQSVSMSITVQL